MHTLSDVPVPLLPPHLGVLALDGLRRLAAAALRDGGLRGGGELHDALAEVLEDVVDEPVEELVDVLPVDTREVDVAGQPAFGRPVVELHDPPEVLEKAQEQAAPFVGETFQPEVEGDLSGIHGARLGLERHGSEPAVLQLRGRIGMGQPTPLSLL